MIDPFVHKKDIFAAGFSKHQKSKI